MPKLSSISLALLCSIIIGVFCGTVQADESTPKIIVTSSQPSGKYSGPIRVELTASDPQAQIWYTCRRNGTPADLIKYVNVITLDTSCALVYFGYVTTQLESRIERSDYTILYSDAIELETRGDSLALVNTSTGTIDIGGWEVISGSGSRSIAPGTTILPSGRYDLGRVDPAVYELRSPEGYAKSVASIIRPPAPKLVASIPVVKVPILEIPPVSPPKIESPIPPVEISPIPEVILAPSPILKTDFIKASSLEASTDQKYLFLSALLGIILISLIIRGYRYIKSER